MASNSPAIAHWLVVMTTTNPIERLTAATARENQVLLTSGQFLNSMRGRGNTADVEPADDALTTTGLICFSELAMLLFS